MLIMWSVRRDRGGGAVPGSPELVVESLVRDCVARDRAGRAPDDLPIIVLWAARGSECSELLRHLERIEYWPGPRAYLDGEALPQGLRPHQVANRLTFQLGRKVAQFGRPRFPRFFLGMAAAGEPLDPDAGPGAREARRALIKSRLRNRSEGWTWLREVAEAITGVAGLDEPVTSAVGLAVDGVIELVRSIALHALRLLVRDHLGMPLPCRVLSRRGGRGRLGRN